MKNPFEFGAEPKKPDDSGEEEIIDTPVFTESGLELRELGQKEKEELRKQMEEVLNKKNQ